MSDSKEMTIAEAQPPQQLITIEPAKYVELVFEPFAKRLADAKTLAEAAQFDVTTTAGMAVAVKHRATFREIRVASEKARKERKAPILEIGKLLDSRQKEIEAEIEPFESRFDAAIKAEESRKEAEKAAKLAAEQARIAAIRSRIDVFRNAPAEMVGKSAQQIGACADHLSETVIALEEFEGSTGEAIMARNAAVARLREMQAAQAAHEAEQVRLAAERAQLERERAEAAERERVAAEARVEQEHKESAALAEIARRDEEVRKALAEERRLQEEAAQRTADAMSEISGIQQQVAIAISGRLGVRKGGTIECIRDTLAETEAWHIDQKRFGMLAGAAEMAKATAVAEIRRLLAEAEERVAAEAKVAADKLEADHAEALAENARIDAERAEAKRIKAEQESAEAEAARITAPVPASIHEIVEMVSISRREYERLMDRDAWLSCLEDAGVDNWEGIEEAIRLRNEEKAA